MHKCAMYGAFGVAVICHSKLQPWTSTVIHDDAVQRLCCTSLCVGQNIMRDELFA